MGLRLTTLRSSHSVSPVRMSILAAAPMSPQVSSLTSLVFLPRMVYRRPSFTFSPVRALTMGRSGVMEPESTFTKEYLPYWSETVLKTKAVGTPPGETTNSSVSPSALVALW